MLRKDVIYNSKLNWELKLPSNEIIEKQAISQIKHGKSTGNVALDRKAIKKIRSEEEEEER